MIVGLFQTNVKYSVLILVLYTIVYIFLDNANSICISLCVSAQLLETFRALHKPKTGHISSRRQCGLDANQKPNKGMQEAKTNQIIKNPMQGFVKDFASVF